MFDEATAECPYCFETISIPIDPGGGHSQDVQLDCEVCCRPIMVHARWDEETEDYRIELDRD